MTTEKVLAWIKSLATKADNYYCGILNSKKEKSFGVYQLRESRAREIALGGLENTKTVTKAISILVHWNSSTRDTENIATALYNDLAAAKNPVIDGHKVNYIKLLHNESIDVGTDDNGICERVIEFVIYYERS
jgi:hypothetical protein